MLRRFIILLVPILLLALSGIFTNIKIFSSQKSIVDSEVADKIASDGVARVIITFEKSDEFKKDKPERGKLKLEVAQVQEKIIGKLSNRKIHYRYQSVPSVVVDVDAETLEQLAQEGEIVNISLDNQGTLALAESTALIDSDYVNRIIVNNNPITGNGAVVATLDSGVDTDHPDLASDIAYERCFLSTITCPPAPHVAEDEGGHGTMVAGIITSDGVVAKKGVAPNAKIAAYKVFSAGIGYGYISDWVAALDDIITNHPEVDIVNMSLASTDTCPQVALETAIGALRSLGIPTFISAGNQGNKNMLSVPACVEAGISVGAVHDQTLNPTFVVDTVPAWSSSADSLDLLAPGTIIVTSNKGGGITWGAGTSFATPHVSGVTALLVEAVPDLTVDEIEQRLKSSGKPITDNLADSDPNTNRTTPRVDASVALLGDDDNDGCGNLAELQTAAGSEKTGGRRNPNNFWDFYDTNHDGSISAADFFAVLGRFGSVGDPTIDPLSSPPPAPAYHTAFDRGPSSGPNSWNLTAADGAIAAADFHRVLAQFGHICE